MEQTESRRETSINAEQIPISSAHTESITKEKAESTFIQALKFYGESFAYNEEVEVPATLSVNYLTELFASQNVIALNDAPFYTALICTVAATLILSIKNIAESKDVSKEEYKKLVTRVIEKIEELSEMNESFGDAFFAQCSIVGRYAPGNLSSTAAYIGAAVVILVSGITGYLVPTIIKAVEGKDNAELAAFSKGKKIGLAAAQGWASLNDFMGYAAIIQAAVGFFSGSTAQDIDKVVSYIQYIGGALYAGFRSTALSAQLIEQLQNKTMTQKVVHGLEKWDGIQEKLATVTYMACQVGIGYAWLQSGAGIFPWIYLGAKLGFPVVNTIVKAFNPPPDSLGEEQRLMEEGKHNGKGENSNPAKKTTYTDIAVGLGGANRAKSPAPEIVVEGGKEEKDEEPENKSREMKDVAPEETERTSSQVIQKEGESDEEITVVVEQNPPTEPEEEQQKVNSRSCILI